MRSITVRLIKPLKGVTVTYTGELLERDDAHILLRALWPYPPRELGFVRFEPGDVFFEHHYSDRWYNIMRIHSADGAHKGWYCNVTRPAVFGEDYVDSEDLELDLFVPPNRAAPLVLDEDEFAQRRLDESDPAAHDAARAALAELIRMAASGEPPFGYQTY
jgi:hypothetical protein